MTLDFPAIGGIDFDPVFRDRFLKGWIHDRFSVDTFHGHL
jgi:hypothetical protein